LAFSLETRNAFSGVQIGISSGLINDIDVPTPYPSINDVQHRLLSTPTPNPEGYLCGLVYFGVREFELIYYNNSHSDRSSTAATDTPVTCLISGFSHGPAPLAWFGLTRALLLRPTEGRITGATRLSLLLSSIEMAVNTLRCPIPIIVQYAGTDLYHGVAAIPPPGSGKDSHEEQEEEEDHTKQAYRTSMLVGALNVDLSTARLSPDIPWPCMHLAGLREMFLEKLGYPWNKTVPSPDVNISVRFVYQLPFWPKLEIILGLLPSVFIEFSYVYMQHLIAL
ncbi:unnamed protein product, partial [Echinostoma caproni]|uniref:Reverse transcriptase domain-containing protein n=1 Tax=Echinostoma caproni TaxID=27848 RepID=A0A183ARK5_9TREM